MFAYDLQPSGAEFPEPTQAAFNSVVGFDGSYPLVAPILVDDNGRATVIEDVSVDVLDDRVLTIFEIPHFSTVALLDTAFVAHQVLVEAQPVGSFEGPAPAQWEGQWRLEVSWDFADYTPGARALINGSAILWVIPMWEFDIPQPAFRVVAFRDDGSFDPANGGGDVSGTEPTEPPVPITLTDMVIDVQG